MRPISKRAALGDLGRKVYQTMIRPEMGLFENVFRLAPYFSMVLGVPAWAVVMGTMGSYALGIHSSQIGKALDEYAGTGPRQIIEADTGLTREDIEEMATSFAEQYLAKVAADKVMQQMFVKEAIPFSGVIKALIQSGKFAAMFGKMVAKMVGGMLVLFGFATVDDMFRDMFAKKKPKLPAPALPEETAPEAVEPPVAQPEEEKRDVDIMIDKLEKEYLGVNT